MKATAKAVTTGATFSRGWPLADGSALARSARERPTPAAVRGGDEARPEAGDRSALALISAAVAHRVQPVFVVTRDGRPLISNRAAEALIRSGALVSSAGRLWVQPTHALFDERWIVRAAGVDRDVAAVEEPLRFPLPARAQDPLMFGMAERLRDETNLPGYLWMVTVFAPAGHQPPRTEGLQRLLGLTRAESRLVTALFASASRLVDVAGACGITHETARSQLRAVFQKCGVGSQAELMRLVALGPFF